MVTSGGRKRSLEDATPTENYWISYFRFRMN